jgi:hypothetical protein
MNRSSVLDLKSPLERGGPLAVGSVDEMTRLRGTLSQKGSKQPGLTRSVLTFTAPSLDPTALKIGGEWSVKLEKGHFRDVRFAHERTRTPSLLFLVLSPHLVLSMLFFETDTLRHFVALLPQGRT